MQDERKASGRKREEREQSKAEASFRPEVAASSRSTRSDRPLKAAFAALPDGRSSRLLGSPVGPGQHKLYKLTGALLLGPS